MRDHKKSPQKWSLKRGLPYLVGNQEVTPKDLVPTVNCSCVGKLFSHSLQSLVPMRIHSHTKYARDFARNGKIIFQRNCNSL